LSLQRQVKSGIGWTTASMLVTTAAQIIQLIVLGRLLSPETFGILALLMIVIGFSELFSQMGLSEAVIQESNPSNTELSTLYLLNITLGIGVFILVISANALMIWMDVFQTITPYLTYVAVTFLISPWGQLYKALLQKQLNFKPIALAEATAVVLGAFTAILLAYNDFSIWSLIIGYIVKCFLLTVFLVISGRNLLIFTFKISIASISRYLHFGLSLMGGNVLNYINSRIDQILIGSLLGPLALGYYSMAFNLVLQPINKINPILTQVAFPVLTRFRDQPDKLKAGYLNMLNLIATLNAPLLFGISAVAPLLIPLLIGEQWTPAIPVIQILAIYAFIRSLGNAGGSLVLACGRADILLKWNGLLTLIIPITIAMSASLYALQGVALGLLVLQAMLFFLWYKIVVRKLIKISLLEYVKAPSIAILSAIIMFFFIQISIPWLAQLSPSQQLIIEMFLGIVSYVSINLVFRKKELLMLLKTKAL
jgi:lipopolysaccharide exporter